MPRQRYWLGLGTNLGDRGRQLQRAVDWLAHNMEVEAVAPIYETAPRDVEDQPPFLNSATRVSAACHPRAMLDLAKDLERDLGRIERHRFGPREVDCDLLLWEGGRWHDDQLTIPHPRLAERRFALLPLLDLDPTLALPDGRSLAEIERQLDADEQSARRASESLEIPGVD